MAATQLPSKAEYVKFYSCSSDSLMEYRDYIVRAVRMMMV